MNVEPKSPDVHSVQVYREKTPDVQSVRVYHPFSFDVLALLIPGSIFGLLVRLGLQSLVTYDGQSIFPLAYVQALGCFVMGFVLSFKEPIGEVYAPVYTLWTTGFCGSLTTFSGWQMDVFESWINAFNFHRPGFRDFIDGLGKSLFTLSLSLASISFGTYLGASIPKFSLPRRPSLFTRLLLALFCVFLYIACLVTYFTLPTAYRHQATASLLFAFPGALTRHVISIYLNPKLLSFPLGTFIANVTGTALSASFHLLQNSTISPSACDILQGLSEGYCGCLTTISTFAAEVFTLKGIRLRSRYILTSWVVGQLLITLIYGSALWSGRSSKDRVCQFST